MIEFFVGIAVGVVGGWIFPAPSKVYAYFGKNKAIVKAEAEAKLVASEKTVLEKVTTTVNKTI